jgi:hypothetical protein
MLEPRRIALRPLPEFLLARRALQAQFVGECLEV